MGHMMESTGVLIALMTLLIVATIGVLVAVRVAAGRNHDSHLQ